MATFLRNLRKSNSADELADLHQIATRLETQYSSLQELVQHADRSIGQLQRLAGLGERVNSVEEKLRGVERLVTRLDTAESQLTGLTDTYQKLETQLTESAASVAESRAQVAELHQSLASTEQLKEEAASVLAMEEPLRQLRRDFEVLQAQGEAQRVEFGRLREQHEATIGNYKAASTRVQQFEEEWQRMTRTLTETSHRIAGLEQLLADFAPATEAIALVRRDLAGARATADQLGQKVAVLDQQREQVDRATAKLDHLTALMQRADAGLERHAELEIALSDLTHQHEAVRNQQESLQERGRLLLQQMEQVEAGQVQAERALTSVRSVLDQSTERVTTDARTAHGLGQRLSDLSRTLTDAEDRLGALTNGSQAIAGAAAQADVLVTQIQHLTAGMQQVTDLGGRVGRGLIDLERLEETLAGLTERTCRLEESRPLLTETVRDLASLNATREAIRDSLEQVRTTREELSRTQAGMQTTRGWLTDTHREIGTLRGEVSSLDRLRATLDALRQEVEQITGAMKVVEARRNLVEEVQSQLNDATSLGAAAEARAEGLQQRLEAAEDHLGTLVPRLDEVGRVSGELLRVGADVRDLEERVTVVQGSLSGMEARADGLETLAERMRGLSREIDQRQNALHRATEHLDRATKLRQEAADAASELGQRAAELDDSLARAGERVTSLQALSGELETRAGLLSSVLERIGGFEAKLAEWRGVEQQVAQAMDQASVRQASVAALQGEVRALYELTGRAREDARLVADAQPELARARAELDGVLTRLNQTDGLLRTLEERRRQADRVEERLARAGVLQEEVRSALETLLAQKAQVDHYIEKTASLSLETRQAEGLLQALRDERRLSDRVRAALAELRPGQSESKEEDPD